MASIEDIERLSTPAIFRDDRVFFTELVEMSANSRHWFGGELNMAVAGLPHGPHALHRVVTIDLTDQRLGIVAANLKHLPLVFGMRFEGCDLTYEVASDQSILIKRSEQQRSSEDWPYQGFPDTLPQFGLRLRDPMSMPLDEFASMIHQGLDAAEPDDLIVVVPSVSDYGGVSLWGEHGWGVQIVFMFSRSDRTVFAISQTD